MNDEFLRYSKQIILDGFGSEGQEKLRKSRIMVAGAGGLGSSVIYYLAAAGAGAIGIADFDVVTLSNLNRQILHSSDDLGKKKTESAKEKIKALNPLIEVNAYPFRLNSDNIGEIFSDYDIVVDCTDNIRSRLLVSDCCYLLDKPLIEGGVVSLEGYLTMIIPDKTACYRCLYPSPPKPSDIKSCNKTGILGSVAGVTGSLMATEAVKFITGIGENLINRALFFDGSASSFEIISLNKNKACPLCGTKTITALSEYGEDYCI